MLAPARFAAVEEIVRSALDQRFSAAVVRIEQRGKLAYERAWGTTRSDAAARAVRIDTRFDLASLTKIALATAVLVLVARGALALDASLVAAFPRWRDSAREAITLRMLLAHTAGMQSGADYRTLFSHDVEAFALERALVALPGERVIYSDLGFIALGALVARTTQRSLRCAFADFARECALEATDFTPRARERAAIPATERAPWRGLVQGLVHDEKAYLMNGIAGHAGLFGTARDVARVTEAYLAPLRGAASLLPAALAREAVREQAPDAVLRRGLGWALRTSDENSCGTRIAPNAFGHTGFTGTCVWADPVRDASIVILTNSVHFGRSDTRDFRAAVCDAVCDGLDG